MLRVQPNPEVVAVLKEIDRRREGLTPIMALSPEERQRWAQAYAEDAAPHFASLDEPTERELEVLAHFTDQEPGYHQVNTVNQRKAGGGQGEIRHGKDEVTADAPD